MNCPTRDQSEGMHTFPALDSSAHFFNRASYMEPESPTFSSRAYNTPVTRMFSPLLYVTQLANLFLGSHQGRRLEAHFHIAGKTRSVVVKKTEDMICHFMFWHFLLS